MEILSQIFGSTARVKIMRLFLFNEGVYFSQKDIATKTRLAKETIAKEFRALEKMGMIAKREVAKPKTKKATDTKESKTTKKLPEYTLDPQFIYTDALKNVLSLNDPVAHQEITERLKKAGRLRLLLVTGVFIGRATERIDMLIVGDGLKKDEIDKALQLIESDVGREIAYACFDTDDFLYRTVVKDRLIRDVFDYPHQKLIDRLEELEN